MTIDTKEFRDLLADFGHNWTNGDEKQAASRANLIAHIDAELVRAEQRGRTAAIDEYRETVAQLSAAQAASSKIVITLRQAQRLVKFFGGHDASVTVMPPAPDWEQQMPGPYAYCTEYPEDGSEYLGPSEVDDELMRLGTQAAQPAAPTQATPSVSEQAERALFEGEMGKRYGPEHFEKYEDPIEGVIYDSQSMNGAWNGWRAARAAIAHGAQAAQGSGVQAELRERVRDAVAQALTGVYYCGRVWRAWQVGTMGEDDFTPAAEVDEVLDSIVDAALAAHPAPSEGTPQEQMEEALACVLAEHTTLSTDGIDEWVPRIIGYLPKAAIPFDIVPTEGISPEFYAAPAQVAQTAEDYLRGKYGAHRGHPEWRALEAAFNAGRAAQVAQGEPVAMTLVKNGDEVYAAYPRRKQAKVYASGLSGSSKVTLTEGYFLAAPVVPSQPPGNSDLVELMKMSESASVDTLRKGLRIAIDALFEIAAAPSHPQQTVVQIVPDWPACNPGCDYETPFGTFQDCRNEHCPCGPAKASVARQRAAHQASAQEEEGSGDAAE